VTTQRIGELLLARQVVERDNLVIALAKQPMLKQRVCSVLIAHGWLDADDAARVLAEQHGMAGVLQRHLAGRDPELAKLLEPTLARSWLALPIGRLRNGDLIVCVRDPVPDLRPKIEAAVRGPVVLAIAPASQLERLVASAYGTVPVGEFDVDLDTGPIAVVEDLGTLRLVDLDDHRVARDPTQVERTGAPSIPPLTRTQTKPSTPPQGTAWPTSPPARPSTPAIGVPRTQTPPQGTPSVSRAVTPIPIARDLDFGEPPRKPAPREAIGSLDAALSALARATTGDDATDIALEFARTRWTASLLLAVKEGAALGHGGHGAQLSDDAVRAIAVPLSAPTIVKVAHDSRRIAIEPPPGAGTIQDRLTKLIGEPPLAAPVFVGSRVGCVLVIGAGANDMIAGAELDRLATALGAALTRIVLDGRRQ
jgi:hypothetical protein